MRKATHTLKIKADRYTERGTTSTGIAVYFDRSSHNWRRCDTHTVIGRYAWIDLTWESE